MIILVLHTEESSSFSSFPFIYTYFSDNKKHSSEYYKYIYLVTQSDYLYKVVLGLLIQYPCEKKHHLEYGNTVFVTVFFLNFYCINQNTIFQNYSGQPFYSLYLLQCDYGIDLLYS